MLTTITIEEGSSVTVRDRLRLESKAAVTQADVYDVVARVFDLNSADPLAPT